jgi:hypothetical protein
MREIHESEQSPGDQDCNYRPVALLYAALHVTTKPWFLGNTRHDGAYQHECGQRRERKVGDIGACWAGSLTNRLITRMNSTKLARPSPPAKSDSNHTSSGSGLARQLVRRASAVGIGHPAPRMYSQNSHR